MDPAAITAVLVAVRQAADAICDRWSFEILLAAFEGETRFTAFVARTGMASRLVASRLRALESLGVVRSSIYSNRPPRRDYRLTPMGAALSEPLRQMLGWEARWRPPGDQRPAQPSGPLADAQNAMLRCRHCGAHVTARDISAQLDDLAALTLPGKRAGHRRSTLTISDRINRLEPLSETLEIFGDKWGIEVLICSFFRVRRFSDFRACTGISANILSDRLRRLEALGILSTTRDGAGAPGYWLTEKGIDLYGVTVAVQEWADGWLPNRARSPVKLLHKACGADIIGSGSYVLSAS